ncbi:phosphonate C-P lyase system protein PhnG [uncultured Rhodospira sp.]|uniref:phosphonate C-P lyase system protein PhnG n=1 Tax=uncultured Rhodospira sp. TaxID=1936189 RepID=UPI002602E27C|nr:phosphonate C-P lyase system protein PhnG [uncultured Rhodospira sp.]
MADTSDPGDPPPPGGTAVETATETEARRRWMAALARAPRAHLESAWRDLLDPAPPVTPLRPAEIGTAMVQARAGGTGARFHLGEMTVTRCSVTVPARDGTPLVGHAYVAGRDRRHADLAARFDALMQDPARRDALESALIAPLLEDQAAARRGTRQRAAASRVDFFTLMRGD